uniref:Copper transport protein n=1 Tax=Lygus hesperus TaxID=30085 RepID=A0A0A9YLL3_LYGHE
MMYFHFGYKENKILFQFWNTASVSDLLIAAIIFGGVTSLMDIVTYINLFMVKRAKTITRCCSLDVATSERCPEHCPPASIKKYTATHFGSTILYGIQTALNFSIMLAFMTYNVWLCSAIVGARVLVYFLLPGKPNPMM